MVVATKQKIDPRCQPDATLAQASLEPAGLELWTFLPNWLNEAKADEWHNLSQSLINWQHNEISMFGKKIPLPRLEAIIGDGNYSYSGLTLKAQPWTEEFLALKEDIEAASGYGFQIGIGNQYRDGNDHIGWHSDDSPEMGKRPAIASISLGAIRKFQLRHKVTREIHTFELTHGSLFIMHPGCQEEYQHRLVKAPKNQGIRINWTFRPLVSKAVIAADNSDLAIIENPTESITTRFKIGDRIITPAKDVGRIYTIQEIDGDDCCLNFQDAAGFKRQNWIPASELEKAPCLIATAQTLWAEIDQAIAVADQAQYSALDSARLCGETLLQLKAETPHGQWETVRNQIVHPRTGKAMPSQTATLYQRIAQNWTTLQADQVGGIKQADESLRKLKPAKTEPETKSPTVGEMARSPYIFDPIDPKTVWVLDDGTWIECKAIAQSDRGWVQAVWADGMQSSIPPHNFSWSNPETIEQDLKKGWISPTDKQPNSLASELKSLAKQKSGEVYNKLCKLNPDANLSGLVAIAEELETAILEILECHFL